VSSRVRQVLLAVVALSAVTVAVGCSSHPGRYTTTSKRVPVGATARLSEVARTSTGEIDFDGYLWDPPSGLNSSTGTGPAMVQLQDGPQLDVTLPTGQVVQAKLIGCK
jgi:hypothetical protein